MPKWKLSAFMMLFPLAASAQGGGQTVSQHFKMFVKSHTKILLDAAESMPADKYSYKPTAAQWTFGKIIAHMAGDNRITCSAIAGVAPEKSPEPSATASKAELVSALKNSLTFCETGGREGQRRNARRLGDVLWTARAARVTVDRAGGGLVGSLQPAGGIPEAEQRAAAHGEERRSVTRSIES